MFGRFFRRNPETCDSIAERLMDTRRARRLDAMTPEQIADAVLDREIDEEDAPRALRKIMKSPEANRRLRDGRTLDRWLKADAGPTPDLSASILEDVGRRRGWLDGRAMRLVSAGRYAVAAGLLLFLALGLFARREAPGAFDLAGEGRPVAGVLTAGAEGAVDSVEPIVSTFESIREGRPTAAAFAELSVAAFRSDENEYLLVGPPPVSPPPASWQACERSRAVVRLSAPADAQRIVSRHTGGSSWVRYVVQPAHSIDTSPAAGERD